MNIYTLNSYHTLHALSGERAVLPEARLRVETGSQLAWECQTPKKYRACDKDVKHRDECLFIHFLPFIHPAIKCSWYVPNIVLESVVSKTNQSSVRSGRDHK